MEKATATTKVDDNRRWVLTTAVMGSLGTISNGGKKESIVITFTPRFRQEICDEIVAITTEDKLKFIYYNNKVDAIFNLYKKGVLSKESLIWKALDAVENKRDFTLRLAKKYNNIIGISKAICLIVKLKDWSHISIASYGNSNGVGILCTWIEFCIALKKIADKIAPSLILKGAYGAKKELSQFSNISGKELLDNFEKEILG